VARGEKICVSPKRWSGVLTARAGGVTLVHGGLRRCVSLGGIISLGLGANLEALSLRALREGALSERTDAAEMRLGSDGLGGGHVPGGRAAEGEPGEGLGDGEGRHCLSDSLGCRVDR